MGAQIYPSTLLDVFIVLSFSGDTPSTLWTLASLRPCRTLVYIRPPCGSGLYPSILWTLVYIRPPCGFWFISVHLGPQILILLGWSIHFVDFVLYPSMLDFKFSSSWDDPSTLWTCFIYIHVELQILILLGWPVHFVDLCNLSIHNKNPCGKSKLYPNILLKRKCVCREKYLPPWA